MKRFDCLLGVALVWGGFGCNRTLGQEPERTTPASERAPAAAPMAAAPSATVPERRSVAAAPSPLASSLRVKRLVVTTGVEDREPLTKPAALPSDGTPIYAFAELTNPDGESENVRITFERQGGAERVGNVTLPVPGRVSRHRTWATTRFIRAAGVWDAVLWSESGGELARTSFEVGAASS